jgi:energy-coupling factor transporter ATP-binding protein EcfA2
MVNTNSNLKLKPLPWNEFLSWAKKNWKQGQHFSLIAPTGSGKTTFAAHLISTRNFVIALDPKGGDTTLAQLGWERVKTWPLPWHIKSKISNHEPVRLIVGFRPKKMADVEKLRMLQKRTLEGVFAQGGWTLYVDEAQILSDPRLMAVRAPLEELMIAARDRKVSVVSSTQAPKWASRALWEQATFVAVSTTRDREIIRRLADVLGQDKAQLEGIVTRLPRFHWIVATNNPFGPLILVKPPKLAGNVVK